jgi:predicted lipoprotein with Yx(FWY)xxD motif
MNLLVNNSGEILMNSFDEDHWRNAHCKQMSGENWPQLKTCFVIVFKH